MNSNTCGYCGSSLGTTPMGKADKCYCGFCEMFVKPSVNGERAEPLQKNEYIGYEHIKLSTPEMMEMHTKSLLGLLKFMRDERRSMFDAMRTLKKVSDMPEYKEGAAFTSSEYEMITRKCFVVENILRDRMGYIPKKITDKLMMSYDERCRDPYNDRAMIIRKPEQAKEPPDMSRLSR